MARKTYRKIIVTPETLKNINPKNKRLKEQFLKHKKLTTSLGTIKAYDSDLNIFFSYLYLHQKNDFFVDLKKFDIIEFFSFASEDLAWGSGRQNRCRSTLSSLSIFIEKVMDEVWPKFKNIILKATESVPKSERREKTVLSDEQVEDLLKYFSEENSQIASWLALAASSGARFSEILRFTVSSLDSSVDVFDGIFLQTPEVRSKGRGVEGRMQKKFIIKDMFLPHYEKWKTEREMILKEKALEHDSLFIRKDGSPATAGTVRSWVRQIEVILGDNFYPHCLRHFIVSYLVRKGIPQTLIVSLMGWKSDAMFNVYNDVDSTDMEWKELDALK